MADILLPFKTDFVDWANQLQQALPDYQMYNPSSLDEWRVWGTKLLAYNNVDAPYPTELFYPDDEDWRDWAMDFITAVG
jgi:hypothetical protein